MSRTDDIILDVATAEDSDDIATGLRTYLQPSQEGLAPASHPKFRNYLLFQLENPHIDPGRRHLVVRRRSVVHGYIDLRPTQNGTHINHLWITSELQGAGLGRWAMLEALRRFSEGSHLDLNVVSSNIPVIRWFETMGTQVDRVDRTYLRPAIEAPPLFPMSPHMVQASLDKFGMATAHLSGTDQKVDFLGPATLKVSVPSDRDPQLPTIADGVAATSPDFNRIAIHRSFPSASKDAQGADLVSVHMSGFISEAVSTLSARSKSAR